MVKNKGASVLVYIAGFYYLIEGVDALIIKINRTDTEAIIKVKTEEINEKDFTFELSPRITEKHLNLILPHMIATERKRRTQKAHRREELKAIKAEKAARFEKFKEETE